MLRIVVHCLGSSLLISIVFSLTTVVLARSPIYVNANATGANNGSSWANAFTSLQSALAVAKSGEEIWVTSGTYKPTSGADRSKSFQLATGQRLYGGFAGTESSRSQRDWKKNTTTLSGDLGKHYDLSDNSYHVVRGAKSAVLDGFMVTDGNPTAAYGGGMLNENASMTVANCHFLNNRGPSYIQWDEIEKGGAMYNHGGSILITSCTFSDNAAAKGGAIYCDTCTQTIMNCHFQQNKGIEGSGIHCLSSTQTIKNSDFYMNQAGYGTVYNNLSNTILDQCEFATNSVNVGGVYNKKSTGVFTRCVFYGGGPMLADAAEGMLNQDSTSTLNQCVFNGCSAGGTGAISTSGCSIRANNCIFFDNESTRSGGGAMSNSKCSAWITNCVFDNNKGGNYFMNSGGAIYNTGDLVSGTSLIATNCTFVNNRNSYPGGAGGIHNGHSTSTLTNCIFWNNATTEIEIRTGTSILRHCLLQSSASGFSWDGALGVDGGGNITGDPRFVNPGDGLSGPDNIPFTADDGLALKADSPCINAGSSKGAPVTDILGRPRRGQPDLGAYEYPSNAVAIWALYD